MINAAIASTLDCRGLLCPLPIIRLSKAVKTVDLGAVIEMLATDPGSVPDMEAFEHQTGHKILERSETKGTFRFLVQRTR